jgi:hypothetical protein
MQRSWSQNLAGPIRPHVIVRFREDCQRVVMRLRMGGTLNAILWFDPRTGPPSPQPQPHPKRQQQPHRGMQDGDKGTNRNQSTGSPSPGGGGAPKTTQGAT